ncbi:MAG: hypothetical protein PWQ29_107 [Verrucomicrobiota bacterium]|jgi:hypothetical protein|nr:hypothetical protein [Verrucomicrobiota bacterium]
MNLDMRKQIVILLLLLIPGGTTLHKPPLVRYLEDSAESEYSARWAEPKKPEWRASWKKEKELPPEQPPPAFVANQIPNLPAFSFSSSSPSFVEQAMEQVVNRTLPFLFKDKDGGYINPSDIFTESGSRGLTISSTWIAPYIDPKQSLPVLNIRILRNQKTGEYEISGGSVELPGTGLEAGYEIQPDSEEHRAILQWKKTF